jgi:Putative beta-barrel porin-2, OmpL-like. bbp2
MKFNKWTLGLAAVGLVSLTSAARADETNMVMTALSTTTISGYVDVASQFNPNGGGGAPNYYYGQPANSINLNVVDIAIDHPQDESPWAAGYHVEFWVGPNGQALGVGNDIRQAYIALRTPLGNGIDWKIGVFDTIVGYESTTTLNNPNYSHSYGYNMEPTTHTGVLGAYKINDIATVQAGVADTSYGGSGAYTAAAGGFGGNTSGLYLPTIMGGVTLTAPDSFGWAKGGTASFDIINTSGSVAGGNASPNNNGNGATTYYAGVTLPTPIAALKFGASFDYLNARDVSGNAWDGALYGTYQFNDKLSLNLRAEYYNGAPLNAAGAYSQNPVGIPLGYGTTQGGDQQAQEFTATVQYALWANVLTRLEFRWDHVNHGNGFSNNTSTSNGEETVPGGLRQDAFMLAAQAVYQF